MLNFETAKTLEEIIQNNKSLKNMPMRIQEFYKLQKKIISAKLR